MPRIIQSPEAFEDIAAISAYIARDNEPAANRWIETIDRKLTLLADFPGIGTHRDELHPGLRGLPVGNYIIFYRPIEGGIEVVRVLHGARNLRRLFRRW